MYKEKCEQSSDISEHLPTLRDLASECNHVTEMGVRGIVSTWAFVEGLKKGGTLISIDIQFPAIYGGDLKPVIDECKEKGINFTFRLGDTRFIEIEPTDLLFIDTAHRYSQLKIELQNHADKARKYIVFHDVVSCGAFIKDSLDGGLNQAIDEFMAEHPEWKVKKLYTNNNGLLIIERI
jgi:hypothetical protein